MLGLIHRRRMPHDPPHRRPLPPPSPAPVPLACKAVCPSRSQAAREAQEVDAHQPGAVEGVYRPHEAAAGSVGEVMNIPDRFWSKVRRGAKDECWPWIAARDEKGYGHFRYKGRVIRAHRFLLIALGNNLTNKVARHSCDNPPCCNPAHLSSGTIGDNVRDCVERGRHSSARGYLPCRKLNERAVIEIRAEFAALPKSPKGYTPDGSAKAIAEKFGITCRNLKMIVNKESWSQL